MTTHDIAHSLHELCNQGHFDAAQKELFAADATSTEMDMITGNLVTTTGVEAIESKGKQFQSMIDEMHSGHAGEPKVFGNHIFMDLHIDATMKERGRVQMDEMCHYEVKDGKIISEQFYF